ncbi:MAG: glucosaminidase domain-containing protein [Chitinophagaceae bacterium]|nr:glucosaminidase domain-containing protein [Chitinophagaceae bacterium]
MKLKNAILFLGLLVSLGVNAQTTAPATITIEEYINTYKEIAMKEMIRTGVPASITLAQGIVETENGNSKLVKKSNNHFGIKCKETWTGPSVSHDDDAPGECFRKYGSAEESYIDHSNFLVTRKHYASLFTLDPLDYKAWAYGLKKAGYATNPRYPEMLIKYIETYNLHQYSLIAMGKKQEVESNVVITETKPPVEVGANTTVAVKEEKEQPKADVPKPVLEIKTNTVAVEEKKAVNYPTGEFKINETRVVYVTKGTPFLSIAQQYNVQLKWLFDFNDLKEMETVPNDQLIYLQRKRRTGANEFHVMAAGETLYDVAQTEGIRLEALLQLNMLTMNQQPAAGARLNLQTQATAAPQLVNTKNTVADLHIEIKGEQIEKIIHVVQPKETLYSISKKYEVSLTALQQWNQLSSTDLKEGMELIINKH